MKKKNILSRILVMALVVVMTVTTMSVAVVSASAASTYTYRLTIKTADESKAGTDKDVYLYAYDANGNQIGKRIALDTKGNSFEKDDTDVVTITLPKAMKSMKVATFGHKDNLFDSFEDDWKLDNIVAELMNGDKVLSTATYTFDQWVECGWYSYVSGNKWAIDEEERLYAPKDVVREKGLEYAVLGDGTAEIIGYTGADRELVVPEYIAGYKVTRIGDYAFFNHESLRSVAIPEAVTSIGDYAFSGCTLLTGIAIPGNVKSIGNYAFSDCILMTEITIPGNVKSIGNYAFSDCILLRSADIHSGVTSIGEGAFYGCKGLANVKVADTITSVGDKAFGECYYDLLISGYSQAVHEYAINNGIDFSAPVEDFRYSTLNNGTIKIEHYSGDGTYVVIPETIEGKIVTVIGEQAFMCSPVENVIIPDSVTYIYELAFAMCQSLTDVTLPDNLIYMDNDVFAHCNKLTSVVIPDKTEYILTAAFTGCTSLENIVIPESVTYLGEGLFINCSDSFTIFGYAGSTAQAYAEENNIRFTALEA